MSRCKICGRTNEASATVCARCNSPLDVVVSNNSDIIIAAPYEKENTSQIARKEFPAKDEKLLKLFMNKLFPFFLISMVIDMIFRIRTIKYWVLLDFIFSMIFGTIIFKVSELTRLIIATFALIIGFFFAGQGYWIICFVSYIAYTVILLKRSNVSIPFKTWANMKSRLRKTKLAISQDTTYTPKKHLPESDVKSKLQSYSDKVSKLSEMDQAVLFNIIEVYLKSKVGD